MLQQICSNLQFKHLNVNETLYRHVKENRKQSVSLMQCLFEQI